MFSIGGEFARVRAFTRRTRRKELEGTKVGTNGWVRSAQDQERAQKKREDRNAERKAKDAAEVAAASTTGGTRRKLEEELDAELMEVEGDKQGDQAQSSKTDERTSVVPEMASLQPFGIELADLGGDGYCGYLSIGAGLAMINKKSWEEIKSRSRLLATGTRLRIADFADAHPAEVKRQWKPDRKASMAEEAGEVPKNADEWRKAVREREGRWICLNALKLAPSALKIDLAVLRWEPGAGWKKAPLLKAKASSVKKREIVALALKQRHYMVGVRPEKGFSQELRQGWEEQIDTAKDWRGSVRRMS